MSPCLLLPVLLAGAAEDFQRTVSIVRDEWGVPHIEAQSDAGAVYGLMKAQAEDNFPQLVQDTASLVGRAAMIRGEAGLTNDLVFQAFECERRARRAYARATPEMRKIAEAYARALNDYGAAHPEEGSPALSNFEPWFVFASEFRPEFGIGRDIWTAVSEIGLPRVPIQEDTTETELRGQSGSNAWAIGPSKSASGRAMLFSNPHVDFFGGGQRYEMHLRSRSGWQFSGFAIFANPLPHAGHNGFLGWSHTNSNVDVSDQYEIRFLDGERRELYAYGLEQRKAEWWTASVQVREGERLVRREFRFGKTHHGPLVARRGDVWIAHRTPRAEEGGYWSQKLAMGKARSFSEFRRAMDMRRIPSSNTTYADASGNIAFWYGNCVPRRATADWSRPVDGSDPRLEWQGYYRLDEIPQVINPRCGWVQNCNSTPFLTAGSDNPDAPSFAGVFQRETLTPRAANSRRILSQPGKLTYEELCRLAFDTTVFSALERVPALVAAYRSGRSTAEMDALVGHLEAWDHRSTVHSTETTLYLTAETLAAGGQARLRTLNPSVEGLLAALPAARDLLVRRYGTWKVPYGMVSRLQRPDSFGRAAFDESRPSLPVAGLPGATGAVFTLYPRPGRELGDPQFIATGASYVSVVEFGPRVRARSIVTFGQSGRADSPHFFDQAPLFARGRFKTAWFYPDEVRARGRQGGESNSPRLATPRP